MSTVNHWDKGTGAILILEEALCILRRFPETLFFYYLGSLPFVLGFLYFWADMSQSAYGADHVVSGALCITVLFIWMKCCHVFFAENLYKRISDQELPQRNLRENVSLISHQTVIHCTGFFVWPLALLLTLPFGWVFAFYHYTSIIQGGGDDIKTVADKSWNCAKHWPMQNHLLILLFVLLYVVVFINVCIGLYLIPHVLKDCFAIDSVFVLSGRHFLNTTFLATAYGLTYLLVNPLIKTAYVVRYSDGNSMTFGNDLKVQLGHLKSHKQAVVMAMLIVLLTATDLWADESPAPINAKPYQTFSPGSLNGSIDHVLSQREFAWRMPHTATVEEEKNASSNQFWEWLRTQGHKMRPVLKKCFKKFKKWWDKLFGKDQQKGSAEPKWQPLKLSRALCLLILGMTCILGTGLFFIWRMKRKNETIQAQALPSTPDISSDKIKADDLVMDEWLKLANDLLSRGDLRLAVRAFYLGTLSQLALLQLITIKQYKSNYDYEIEIKRRARDKEPLCGFFSQSVAFLNSVWYGSRDLQPQEVLEFARQQEQIILLANA